MDRVFIPPAKPIIGDEERAAVDRSCATGMVAQGRRSRRSRRSSATSWSTVATASRSTPAPPACTSACWLPASARATRSSCRRSRSPRPPTRSRSPGRPRSSWTSSPTHYCLDARCRRGGDHRAHQGDHAGPPVRPPGRHDGPAATSRSATALLLFEDAAQAHGASLEGAPVGTFGTFAMFSLYPTKNMTSGEGGMVSCADDELARSVRLLRNQGMERSTPTRSSASTTG